MPSPPRPRPGAALAASLLLAACAAGSASGAGAPRPVFQRGVCYAHAWRDGGRDGYGSARSGRTLARLRSLGVTWISLTPFGFVPSLDAPTVRRLPSAHGGAGESDERIEAETRRAHKLGMRVTLKPHLWVARGAWQGALRFPSDDAFRAFLASYRAFLLHYAALAERLHVDLFVVGTELRSVTARDGAALRPLIAEVRRVYHGPLTYAANWDEAAAVDFWDALDYVGVDAYAPLTRRSGAPPSELAAAWKELAGELMRLSRRAGRPVILTELGYRAARDAAMSPSTWPESDPRPAYDPAHQAACYRAALSSLWGQPWLQGIYVWKYFTDDGDEHGPTDFPPSGKPAERVLSEFYGR